MDKLIDKLHKELEKYQTEILNFDRAELLDCSYEFTVKKELVYAIEDSCDNLSEKFIEALLKKDNLLQFLYEAYLDNDSVDITNELRYFINILQDESTK